MTQRRLNAPTIAALMAAAARETERADEAETAASESEIAGKRPDDASPQAEL